MILLSYLYVRNRPLRTAVVSRNSKNDSMDEINFNGLSNFYLNSNQASIAQYDILNDDFIRCGLRIPRCKRKYIDNSNSMIQTDDSSCCIVFNWIPMTNKTNTTPCLYSCLVHRILRTRLNTSNGANKK